MALYYSTVEILITDTKLCVASVLILTRILISNSKF